MERKSSADKQVPIGSALEATRQCTARLLQQKVSLRVGKDVEETRT